MAPPTSPAWQFFTVRDYGMAECHLCHKFIRYIKNTSPLIAHLRCKHAEVLPRAESSNPPIAQYQAEIDDKWTQTCDEDFELIDPLFKQEQLEPEQEEPLYREIKEEPLDLEIKEEVEDMEYDMNLRLREMMALRLDDAVGNMQFRVATDPMAQLVRSLCESCMWLIRDWPNQKIDNLESVRASRLDTLGRLRQLLRARPPKNSEMDGLILLLSDALLTISEQWPGGESDDEKPKPATVFTAPQQPPSAPQHRPVAATVSATVASVHIPPVYGAQGSACKPPAPKLPRMAAKPWTVDGFQQPSTSSSHSSSFPPPHQQRAGTWNQPSHREMPQASNAGTPSVLWTFFKKQVSTQGTQLAKCTVCGRQVPRHNCGTSGMKNHLKVHHPAEYATLGMDSSASSENSQSSPPGVPRDSASPKMEQGAADKGRNVSAIIAALNSETANLPDMSNSPVFNSDYVKEEEMDYDEILNELNDNDAYVAEEEARGQAAPSTSSATINFRPSIKGGSEIWAYFTKADASGGEKHGCCNLCDWSRRIYNHGTNTMWAHLRRMHPHHYAQLKPNEYNPAFHGQIHVSGLPGGTVSLVPGTHLTLTQAAGARCDSLERDEDEVI